MTAQRIVHILIGFAVALLVIVLGDALIDALHPDTTLDLKTIWAVVVILAWLWWAVSGAVIRRPPVA